MKNIRRLAFLFAALIAVPPLSAGSLRLKSITFEGTHALKPSALRKVMSTKFPSRFAWLPGMQYPEFNEAALKRDIRSIGNLYQSEGYYHSAVQYALDQKRSAVSVRITVEEGKPSRINEVRFLVDGTLDNRLLTILEKQVPLRQGKIFRIEDYNLAKDTAERFLGNNGYSRASVTGQAVVIKAEHHVDITFTLRTGPLQYFDDVSLLGNETVRDIDILRELSFKKGDVFSRDRIARSQRHIFQLGLFRSVVVTPDETEEKEIPVDIEVEENEKRSLNLGVGYGTEDRLRLSAEWSRRYLFDRPRTLTAAVKHSSLIFLGTLDLTQRYFIDKDSNLNLHLGYERDYFVSYSNEFVSSQVRVGRRFSDILEGFVGYNLELNHPVSVDPATLQLLTTTKTGDYYFISSIQCGVKLNTVPGNLAPLNGYSYSVFFEPSTFLLASGLDFIRSILEGRQYNELSPGLVLATREEFGFIQPYRDTKDIPIFKRFFAGGSSSIRGYGFQMVGPLDSAGKPLGGNYLTLGNVELRYPLFLKDLGGVAFLDGGNVFANRAGLAVSGLRYGTGVGLRYNIIVGPLRVDLAFPVSPSWSMLWGQYVVYFSIGNIF